MNILHPRSLELRSELHLKFWEGQGIERQIGEKDPRERREKKTAFYVSWKVNSRLTSVCPSVCLSVLLHVTCFCFFVILFCSFECRSHCCCSCHVGLKSVLFATQPTIANCVSSCSSSVPSPALCVVSRDQCGGCDHVCVVCCVLSRLALLSFSCLSCTSTHTYRCTCAC